MEPEQEDNLVAAIQLLFANYDYEEIITVLRKALLYKVIIKPLTDPAITHLARDIELVHQCAREISTCLNGPLGDLAARNVYQQHVMPMLEATCRVQKQLEDFCIKK